MRTAGLLLALLISATIPAQHWDQTHTQEDLERFLLQTFAGADSASLTAAYRTARSKGWLTSQRTRTLLKKQLRQLARLHPTRGRAIDLRPQVANPNRPAVARAAAAEREYNDSEGFANDLGFLLAPLSATGALSPSDDKDTYRFQTLTDGIVTFKTTYSGGFPPDLMITNAAGDENWGYHYYEADQVVVQLPIGTYHVSLAGGGAPVTYSTAITIQNQTIPTQPFGTSSHTFGIDPKALKFDLPQAGRLQISLTNNASVDSYLIVQNDSWGYIYDVEEASTGSNGEPGLDAHLPKGTYYVYLLADATVTETVTSSFSPQAIPVLASSGTGSLMGSGESMDLFEFVVTSPEFVDLRISGTGSNPTSDSYLILYDQNMVQLLEADDDPNGSMSALGVTLPAGTYYVASNAYWESGDYQITKTTAAAATRTARAGLNSATVAQFSTATLKLTLQTPSWVEFDIVQGPLDAQIGVLDWNTGLGFAWEDDENLGPRDCNYGMHLPAGEFLIMVKDYEALGGNFDLRILLPLQRWQNDNVVVQGHAGDVLFFVAGTKLAPANNPFPGLITGNLLIDLPTGIVLATTMPPSGRVAFMQSLPPGSGVYLQLVTVDRVTGQGSYSNLLR